MNDGTLTVKQLRRIQKALGTVPFARLIGIELEEIGSGTATLAVKVRKELTQNQGVVHGGVIASLIDTATAFAIITLLAPREKVTTVDLTISYLRPVAPGAPQSPGQGREGWPPSFRGFRRSFLRRLKPNSDST
jgi:uncharacterized protein (TIGR00369 family)